jgi:hypothetical protein
MAQLLIHLPDDLVSRLRQAVPARRRSRFVQELIEAALPSPDDDPIYQAALAVERDEVLSRDMAEWENAAVGDGLKGLPWSAARAHSSSRATLKPLAR